MLPGKGWGVINKGKSSLSEHRSFRAGYVILKLVMLGITFTAIVKLSPKSSTHVSLFRLNVEQLHLSMTFTR